MKNKKLFAAALTAALAVSMMGTSVMASTALNSAQSIASTLRPYPKKHYIRQFSSAFKPWPVTRMISCKTSGMSKRTLSSFPGAKSLLNHWKSKSTSWSRKCPP